MIRTEPLRELAHQLLDAAQKAGASEADALTLRGASTSIDVRGGQLEHAERADGVEIGLRVIVNGRQACVSASDISADTIAGMAERAVAMAREAPLDDTIGLAEPSQLTDRHDADGLDLEEPGADPAPAALQEAALRAEAAALAVPGISQCESASASFVRRALWLAGTNGLSAGYGRTSHAISAVAIAGHGTGMERDWASEGRTYVSDLPSPEEIGALAGQRTVARIGARRPPTGAYPILFDQRVSATLIGHLLSAINGQAIARGASWLRDAMDQPVLRAGLTLREDPLIPRFASSRPFDAEGLVTRPRNLVEDGVLTGWILDLATGRKLGLPSTANATRGASSPPQPGAGNVILNSGAETPEALIAAMGRGLVVTSLLGSSINSTTGDYSRGAAGFWVEGGQIAYPVNECTIAGNLRDMLLTLRPADDTPAWRALAVPSLLVHGMTVAGA